MPRIPETVSRKKNSRYEDQDKRGFALDALIRQTQDVQADKLILTRTKENHLKELFRHEVLSALEQIRDKYAIPILIDSTNYAEVIEPEYDAGLGSYGNPPIMVTRVPEFKEKPEGYPITLRLMEEFRNWRYAYLHKQAKRFSDLTPVNQERVWKTVLAIDEKFQLSSTPTIVIDWDLTDPTRNHDSREGALQFLEGKGAVNAYKFRYVGIGGFIKVEIDIERFQALKTEILKLREASFSPRRPEQKTVPSVPKNPLKPFQHLKWENLTIQFIDGHNVKLSAKDTQTITAHYKEMGFEDRRSRNPNGQWDFLKNLAEGEGEFAWDNPKATESLKKTKQALSNTLRNYFGISDDPFYPYKETRSYRIKIHLASESQK